MTNINPAAEAARENARTTTGQFGTQEHSTPDLTLAVEQPDVEFDNLRDEYAALFRESEEKALDFIQTNAPEGAVRAVFEWSDQGNFLELAAFDLNDDETISAGDVVYGDNDDDQDVELFEDMMGAARNVESPYVHGLSGDSESVWVNMDFEGRTAKPVTREELQDINTRTVAAQGVVEVAAIDRIRRLVPSGVTSVTFEPDEDELGYGLVLTGFTGAGAPRLDDEAWEPALEYLTVFESTPSQEARVAGLTANRDGSYTLQMQGGVA